VRKALLLLGILNDADLDWLVAAGTRRTLPQDAVIIREGEPAEEVFIVLDGVLAVRTAKTGATDIARLRGGEVVGEMSFVDARPPAASVHAAEPSVVLAIPRAALAAKIADDVHFAARFYRALAVFLSQRLRNTVGLLDYGTIDATLDEEIEPGTLDNLTLAGARFEWLQKRVKPI
jgi:CRP/FNR family transcriptional regulator, cyclic AMP receptor protein